MTKQFSRDTTSTDVIRTEASSWLAQLESGELDYSDVEVLREWMSCSPKHTAELRRLAKLSRDMNVLSEMSGSLKQAVDFHYPVTRRHRRPLLPGFALVGGLVLTVLSLGLFLITEDEAVEEPQAFTTEVGEYEEYYLSDASVISLNTNSRVTVDYSEYRREVHLHSGEALFTVVKDVNRPFVVKAGTKRVEAVGTAFLIRLEDSEIEVSVTEGRVRLTDTSVPGATEVISQPDPILLEMGQSLKVQQSSVVADIKPVSEIELQSKLAWREGLLDFHRTTLSNVVKEVGRHTGLEIEIGDEELGSREFDGLFRVGETESLFEALKLRYGVKVTYLDTKTVLLSNEKSY